MSDSPSSVPRVRKPRRTAIAVPVKLTFPSRYRYQFPPPDDESFEVNKIAFALQYFAGVFVLFVGTAGFTAFVLVPVAGLFLR